MEGQRLEFGLGAVADRAMVRESGRARARAAKAEVTAVRRAVVRVSSLISSGSPVLTCAKAPKAITVDKPACGLSGWPFTNLKL